MTHAEAAELLGVSDKTIQRRLRRSVLLLLAEAHSRDLVPSEAMAAENADALAGPDRADRVRRALPQEIGERERCADRST